MERKPIVEAHPLSGPTLASPFAACAGRFAVVAALTAGPVWGCGASAAVPDEAQRPCEEQRVRAMAYLPDGTEPLSGDALHDLRALETLYETALVEAQRAFGDGVAADGRRAFFWRWVQRDNAPLRLDVDRFVLAEPLAEAGACLATATGEGDPATWRRRGGLVPVSDADE